MQMKLTFLKKRKLAQQIEAYYDDMLRLAMSWCRDGDMARSLVQQTVAIALTRIDQLRDEKALKSWLFTIMNRRFCDCKRLEAKRQFVPVEEYTQVDEYGPQEQLEQSREIERVRQALATISDDHRRIITLVDVEGYSYREVAEILEIRIGTVMSRVSRARSQLKQLLLQEAPLEKGGKVTLRRVK